MKAVILDSGPLINLSMNGLLYIIKELKEKTGVRFFITKDVKYETLDRPIGVPRFELGALRISELLREKIIEMPSSLNVEDKKIDIETKKLIELANHFASSDGKFIKIVSDAEISCLALSDIMNKIGIENLVAVDERTTRVLGEDPSSLQNLMSEKLHSNIKIDKIKSSAFSKYRFIRSTELVFVAVKLGVIGITSPKILEAVLYATKFKGAAVSFDEINVLKKL